MTGSKKAGEVIAGFKVLRHCERSEAIQSHEQKWIASLHLVLEDENLCSSQ